MISNPHENTILGSSGLSHHQQQQHQNDLLYTPTKPNRKRKLSADDDEMMSLNSSPSNSPSRAASLNIMTPSKRIKMALTAHLLRSGMKQQQAISANNVGTQPSSTLQSSPQKQQQQLPSSSQIQEQQQEIRKEQVLPLKRILETLEKDDLLTIITTLVADNPGLEGPVAALLPRPTLSSASSHIQQCQKRLDASFPYSRFGQDRSDYAFNRVRPHLNELTELISLYLTYFTEPSSYPPDQAHEYPSVAFGFLKLAGKFCGTLPTWQTEEHTLETKSNLYSLISGAWKIAIAEISRRMRDEGRMYGASLVGEWYRDLLTESNGLQGSSGFVEALQEFHANLGWVIGIGPAPTQTSSVSGSGAGYTFFPMMTGHGGMLMGSPSRF
jgi:hypothetical protein